MTKFAIFSKLQVLQAVSVLIFSDLFQITSSNKCDEQTFYKPYVLVKKKRNGGDIATLRSTGFLDLRFRNRVILCINGPAILYPNAERIEPDSRLSSNSDLSRDSLTSYPDARFPSPDHAITDTNPSDDEVIFKNGTMRVFNHECFSANRVSINLLKKMKADQGRVNPELMSDTQVTGKLVLGIYLIGDKEGHDRPVLAWLKGRHYEYVQTKDKTVKDSSFYLSNIHNTYCMDLPDGTNIKIGHLSKKPSMNLHVICGYTLHSESFKPMYARAFQRGYDMNGLPNGDMPFQESDYKIYVCSDHGPDDRIMLMTMAKTTPQPVTHANYTEFDPFSLFNPNLWTPHGYRKDSYGLSGGDERSEDRGQPGVIPQNSGIPCSVDPTNPFCLGPSEIESTTLRDMQNVFPSDRASVVTLGVGNCVPLPVYNKTKCIHSNNGHRLLEIVLELVPQFVSADPIKLGVPPTDVQRVESPKYLNLNDNATLAWKFDLLYQTAEIFTQLCMPFRAEMPYTVARVFAWYLMRAHLFGETMGIPKAGETENDGNLQDQFDKKVEKSEPWPILIKELERCSDVAKNENGGKGLKFQWDVGDDSGKWKIPSVGGRETRRRKRRNVETVLKRPKRRYYENEESIRGSIHEKAEKNLSRKKRSGNYKINGSVITTKYVLPGKSLAAVMSEGTWGFAREAIQEHRTRPDLNDPRADTVKYADYPQNIQHCFNPKEDPVTNQIVCSKTEELFFYEDHLEIVNELNVAIDLWWKIWATVIGYCNKAYHSRKSETFPRMYSSKYEYFFRLVEKEWLQPTDNDDLKVIFSEYITDESQVWMDSCLEAAYINSNSQSFRPPRPAQLFDREKNKTIANYFEDIPYYLYYRYHPDSSVSMK